MQRARQKIFFQRFIALKTKICMLQNRPPENFEVLLASKNVGKKKTPWMLSSKSVYDSVKNLAIDEALFGQFRGLFLGGHSSNHRKPVHCLSHKTQDTKRKKRSLSKCIILLETLLKGGDRFQGVKGVPEPLEYPLPGYAPVK